MNYFITGTDTGVGKTYFTVLLARAARRAGFDTAALKPVCCGSRADVDLLRAAAGDELSADDINPLWFQASAAPLVAARRENREVDFHALGAWFRRQQARRRSLLVEGAGGWLVPLADGKTVADLAALIDLPVLVVAANRLGCLNHAFLTVESIRARGLVCAGLVLNTLSSEDSVAVETNRGMIEEFCDAPVLFEIQPGQKAIELAVA